jgi:hypothetical protein
VKFQVHSQKILVGSCLLQRAEENKVGRKANSLLAMSQFPLGAAHIFLA